jgi:hypothetical protein
VKLAGVILLAVALLVPASAQAKPATLSGKLTGGPIPAVGKGIGIARAMRLKDGVVAAADYTDAKGRWQLRVPPATYALLGTVFSFAGGSVRTQLGAVVRAKSGQRKTLTLSLKRKKKRKKGAGHARAAVADGFGDVAVDYPAIWVKSFHTDDSQVKVFEKGMADLLITDLAARGGCDNGTPVAIVEREKLQDILNEQKLSNSPYFDPSTRVPKGHLIKDNASVTGTITRTGHQVDISATYTDRRRGYTKTVTATGTDANIFAIEQQLIPGLVDAICNPPGQKPAGTVSGTFNGSGSFNDNGFQLDLTWSGDVTFAPGGQVNPQDPQYYTEVWNHYTVTSGTVTLSGTGTGGGCTLDIPSAQYPLNPMQADAFNLQPSGAHYTVWLTFPNNETVTATQNCPNQPPQTGPFPIGNLKLVYTPSAHQSSGPGSFTGTDSYNGSNYSWNLSGG